MKSVEELRRALEAARAETAALRAAAEGADRAPRGSESGDAGEADSGLSSNLRWWIRWDANGCACYGQRKTRCELSNVFLGR